MVAGGEREIDLAHQLVGEAEAIRRLRDGRGLDRRQRMEIERAGGAGDRVERPCRLEARLDAGGVGDVDADVARLRAGGDDVVARRKLGRDRAPEHAARADKENAKTGGHGA